MHRTSTAIVMIAALGTAPGLAATWTYEQLDENRDGELTLEEFGRPASEAVQALDTNKDGMVSAGEFKANHPEVGVDVNTSVPQWDASGDGVVDQAEVRDGMFAAYDLNGNAVVDQNEFADFTLAAAGDTSNASDVRADTLHSDQIVELADWNYSQIYENGLSIDWLIGSDALNEDGDDIGQVENILLAPDGRVLSVVAEIGGFFELADTHVSIPWNQVQLSDSGVIVPVAEGNIDEYSLFRDDYLMLEDAATHIQEVQGDGWGEVITGPRIWRATELIGDYARLIRGDRFVEYGLVQDILIDNGQVSATVISPDGIGGYYGYPYHSDYWDAGSPYYDLPYDIGHANNLQPFEYDRLETSQPDAT